MYEFRSWLDEIMPPEAAAGMQLTAGVSGGPKLSAEAENLVVPTTVYIDRAKGEGPPPCCGIRRVAADALVWYGGLPDEVLERVRAALPMVADIPAEDLYLCDGCRGRLQRWRVLTPAEMPRSRPPASERD